MAPAHPTALPELENPIIAALLAYTRAGNRLSNIDVIKAAMPKLGPDLEPRRPASSTATPGAIGAAAPTNEAVVASLLARADSIPADPLDQMRALSGAGGAPSNAGSRPAGRPPAPQPYPQPNPAAPPNRSAGGQSRRVDSVGGWLQRHRSED
jgi:hypothetical protein